MCICVYLFLFQVGVDGWSDVLMRRFLHRIGLTHVADKIMTVLSDPTDHIHMMASDLEEIGVRYWDGARVLAGLRVASERRVCVSRPVRVVVIDDQENVSCESVMQWDAETLAQYLESKGGMDGTARTVREEEIVGFVFATLDVNTMREDVMKRLVKQPEERVKVRNVLLDGE
jgi:hypothetical protein